MYTKKRSRVLLLTIAAVAISLAALIGPAISALTFDPLKPQFVHLFNDDTEVGGSGIVLVASLTYSHPAGPHRLTIALSAVGALIPDNPSVPALFYLGCHVDGVACVGHQTNPGIIPAGWVNVNSNNFPASSSWDNTVGYTWLAPSPLGTNLSPGTHTVEIHVAPGNALPGCGLGGPGCGGPGITHIEARNLIVTILVGGGPS